MEITAEKKYRTISFSPWDNTAGTIVTDKEPAPIQIPIYSFNGISGLCLKQSETFISADTAPSGRGEPGAVLSHGEIALLRDVRPTCYSADDDVLQENMQIRFFPDQCTMSFESFFNITNKITQNMKPAFNLPIS